MVGLGEMDKDMEQVMIDIRAVDCDILTIGQYLQPSDQHLEVEEYVNPLKFELFKNFAELKGFKHVASGPFVRSSYNASLGLEKIKDQIS